MAFPSNPINGQSVTINNVTYTYYSAYASWTRSSTNWAGITYVAAPTPPTVGVTNGSQWYDTASDTLFTYEYDGVSSHWVDISTPTFSTNNSSAIYSADNATAYINVNLVPTLSSTYSIGTSAQPMANVFVGNVYTSALYWASNGNVISTGGSSSGSNNITAARVMGYNLVFGG